MDKDKYDLKEYAILEILGWDINEEDKQYIGNDYEKFFKELLSDFVRDLILVKDKAKNKDNILTKDEDFKTIYKYRAVLALLLKYSLLEFKDVSIFRILSLIPSDKNNFSIVEEVTSESVNVEAKLIRYDLVFDIEMPEDLIINDKSSNKSQLTTITITVNVEHQGDYELEYPLKKRMVYYNCRKIDKQLNYEDIKNDSASYNKVHKVYTIWFCLGNIFNDISIVHRKIDGIVTSLDGIQKDLDLDMSEIIIIEYKKLAKAIENDLKNKGKGKKLKYHPEELTAEARLLYLLTKNNIDKSVEKVSEYLKLDLKVNKKEVSKMKSAFELYAEQKSQEGEQRGRLEGKIISIIGGLRKNIMPSILAEICHVDIEFVGYVEDYFKENSYKSDEENVSNLVEEMMNKEMAVK